MTKVHTRMDHDDQCDQMEKLFSKIWPFIMHNGHKIFPKQVQKRPNTTQTLQKLPNTFIIWPKCRNFAKSGHTDDDDGQGDAEKGDNSKLIWSATYTQLKTFATTAVVQNVIFFMGNSRPLFLHFQLFKTVTVKKCCI